MKKIGIIFCGGCNPKINRKETANKLTYKLKQKGYEVDFNTLLVDYIVYLSGCTSGCARKTAADIPATDVSAFSVNASTVANEEQMLEKVIENIDGFFK